jgi:hypothetical protein
MADFSVEVDPPTDKPVEELVEAVPKIVPRETVLIEKSNQNVAKEKQPMAQPMVQLVEDEPMVKENQPTQIADTIEINHSQAIFPHIEAYPETSPKQHHFRFKHQSERTKLIQIWAQRGITAEFNESGNADVILTQEERLIGKLQFLHFDRRDRSVRSKYYVKVYLQFEDREMLEQAKQIMRSFLEEIAQHRSSIRKSVRKTRKLRHKKRSTRKLRKHSK